MPSGVLPSCWQVTVGTTEFSSMTGYEVDWSDSLHNEKKGPNTLMCLTHATYPTVDSLACAPETPGDPLSSLYSYTHMLFMYITFM